MPHQDFLSGYGSACTCKMWFYFSPDGSEGDYNEDTELFEQECDDFMKEFVAKIFLKE